MVYGDHSQQPLRRDIFRTVRPFFDEIWQGPLACDCRRNVKISNFCKSNIATASNIKIGKLPYILAMDGPNSTKIVTVMEVGPLKSISLKNWNFRKDGRQLVKAIQTPYLHNRLKINM